MLWEGLWGVRRGVNAFGRGVSPPTHGPKEWDGQAQSFVCEDVLAKTRVACAGVGGGSRGQREMQPVPPTCQRAYGRRPTNAHFCGRPPALPHGPARDGPGTRRLPPTPSRGVDGGRDPRRRPGKAWGEERAREGAHVPPKKEAPGCNHKNEHNGLY